MVEIWKSLHGDTDSISSLLRLAKRRKVQNPPFLDGPRWLLARTNKDNWWNCQIRTKCKKQRKSDVETVGNKGRFFPKADNKSLIWERVISPCSKRIRPMSLCFPFSISSITWILKALMTCSAVINPFSTAKIPNAFQDDPSPCDLPVFLNSPSSEFLAFSLQHLFLPFRFSNFNFFSPSLLKTFSKNPFQGQYPNIAVRIINTTIDPRPTQRTQRYGNRKQSK